jgi:hypothetical protein
VLSSDALFAPYRLQSKHWLECTVILAAGTRRRRGLLQGMVQEQVSLEGVCGTCLTTDEVVWTYENEGTAELQRNTACIYC